jgi:hypothetical protein
MKLKLPLIATFLSLVTLAAAAAEANPIIPGHERGGRSSGRRAISSSSASGTGFVASSRRN